MKKRLSGILCLLLLLTSAISVAPASNDKKSLTAAEIISKHIAALGGKEKLGQLKTRAALGTVKRENEPASRIVIASEATGRLAVIYKFEQYDWRLNYNGTKAAMRPILSRELSVVTDKYQEMLASGLMFNGISLYNLLTEPESNDVKFEAKGTKNLHGRPAYIVEVRGRNVAPMRLYFDAQDFMWVRTDYGNVTIKKYQGPFTNDVVSHADDDIIVDFYIETSDFREVDGVKLPFRFEQVVTSPILRQRLVGTLTGTILEYRHNIDIDPKFYQ